MPEKTYKPQFFEEVINSLGPRRVWRPRDKGTADYFSPLPGSLFGLSQAQMYEFWLKGKHCCPHCKTWHRAGTRHRNFTVADTAGIDAAMAERHASELAKREEKK